MLAQLKVKTKPPDTAEFPRANAARTVERRRELRGVMVEANLEDDQALSWDVRRPLEPPEGGPRSWKRRSSGRAPSVGLTLAANSAEERCAKWKNKTLAKAVPTTDKRAIAPKATVRFGFPD